MVQALTFNIVPSLLVLALLSTRSLSFSFFNICFVGFVDLVGNMVLCLVDVVVYSVSLGKKK